MQPDLDTGFVLHKSKDNTIYKEWLVKYYFGDLIFKSEYLTL